MDKEISPFFQSITNNNIDEFTRILNSEEFNYNKTYNNFSPLYLSVYYQRKNMVNLLLKKPGIDVNFVHAIPIHTTSLLYSIHIENHDILELLLAHGDINVNLVDTDNKSPLYNAILTRNLKNIELLLKHYKIDVNQPYGLSEETPLHLAALANFIETVKLLLAHPHIKINMRNKDKKTAIFIAAEEGHVACVKLLFGTPHIDQNIPDLDGNTPLMIAAKNWHFECVKILLMDDVFTKINMNPETRGQFITTSLCNSSTQTPIPQLPTLVIKTIFAFFQQKTSLDATNDMGQTALYLAAANGHFNCVKILLYYKCDRNIADNDRITPLRIATENNHQDCVTELQKTQAEIENDYYEL